MPSDVDEIFGGEDAPKPRTALTLAMLLSGLVVALLGMACTTAPGGVLVLLSWMIVEKELDRVDSGYLAETDRRAVQQLRMAVGTGLAFVIALFLIQAVLLCQTNLYESLLVGLLDLIAPPR